MGDDPIEDVLAEVPIDSPHPNRLFKHLKARLYRPSPTDSRKVWHVDVLYEEPSAGLFGGWRFRLQFASEQETALVDLDGNPIGSRVYRAPEEGESATHHAWTAASSSRVDLVAAGSADNIEHEGVYTRTGLDRFTGVTTFSLSKTLKKLDNEQIVRIMNLKVIMNNSQFFLLPKHHVLLLDAQVDEREGSLEQDAFSRGFTGLVYETSLLFAYSGKDEPWSPERIFDVYRDTSTGVESLIFNTEEARVETRDRRLYDEDDLVAIMRDIDPDLGSTRQTRPTQP